MTTGMNDFLIRKNFFDILIRIPETSSVSAERENQVRMLKHRYMSLSFPEFTRQGCRKKKSWKCLNRN
jgi:hypothetical protein